MNVYLENTFLGVVSGLITSLVLYIFFVLWRKVVNPWWENRLYKGVFLDGTWVGKKVFHHKIQNGASPLHEELNIQLDLNQSGYKIKGIFSAESMLDGKSGKCEYKNLYRINGCIHDNFALMEYHPLSQKRTGLGTFLLEVKNGGKDLVGNITFLEEGDMTIETLPGIVLVRKNLD